MRKAQALHAWRSAAALNGDGDREQRTWRPIMAHAWLWVGGPLMLVYMVSVSV